MNDDNFTFQHIAKFALIFPIEVDIPELLYPVLISEISTGHGDFQQTEVDHFSFTKRMVNFIVWSPYIENFQRLITKINKFVEENEVEYE